MSDDRKYKFSYELIFPETDDFRPSLGNTTTLEMYHLFQFSLRDVAQQRFGTEATDELFRESGRIAGQAMFNQYFSKAKDVPELANMVQEKFRELSVGIVRFEKVDLEKFEIQLTVDEDLDCSGLPDSNDQICIYDEGLIQGILESFTGKRFYVRETDCWCSGERTCRFVAKLAADE